MDRSDEKQLSAAEQCVTQPLAIVCDDHKCPINWWSCGDGQCISHFQRSIYQTVRQDPTKCFSMREFNYMCELAADMSLWTKSNGHCAETGYNDTSLILSSNVTNCTYYIRCALSRGAEAACPCNGTDCNPLMKRNCIRGVGYVYPTKGLIRPWLMQLYFWERSWNNKVPNFFALNGSFRCRGFRAVLSVQDRFTFVLADAGFVYSILEKLFCPTIPLNNRNITSSYKYSATCWNDSFTFNRRPYAFYDVCPNLNLCFSEYRITDAVRDCFNGEDEKYPIVAKTSHCRNTRKHRFQCCSEQITCSLD